MLGTHSSAAREGTTPGIGNNDKRCLALAGHMEEIELSEGRFASPRGALCNAPDLSGVSPDPCRWLLIVRDVKLHNTRAVMSVHSSRAENHCTQRSRANRNKA